MRSIVLGIFASFFFAVTFILNRAMSLAEGSWIWIASLRYLFMIPFLLLIVISRKNLRPLLQEMRLYWVKWMIWSTVGFGLFYAPLCFAAAYSPGWLVAGTWQITIISGSLLVPLFYETVQTPYGMVKRRGTIPFKGLSMSLIILMGIALMQVEQVHHFSVKEFSFSLFPVIIASFAYPLGNRKMMELCQGRLDSYQRVLGMTLASLPFWLLISIVGLLTDGLPKVGQMQQSFIVAISSGVVATILFFRATDLVKDNMHKLAAVEATQSLEVLFTVVGELVLLGSPAPAALSWMGMVLVIIGMILHSYSSQKKAPVNVTTA
ncbi:DMT family transporter [Paenibacillus cremeus]|uniref:Multidrug resistance efflux transporter family protein n=1 Tax=Paenibacillus cremeus TaxID=2163881 RepID=A0A559KH28_9BACL|nr:multidrug resistance efflux transporter family protein [Paenibacillus cremeus]TVY11443.1 multidrug resistance efflux transporter family protein [Paenibacillus cremeus]